MLEYEETHQTLTDHYGLFNLVIGEGSITNNGIHSDFVDIVWIVIFTLVYLIGVSLSG